MANFPYQASSICLDLSNQILESTQTKLIENEFLLVLLEKSPQFQFIRIVRVLVGLFSVSLFHDFACFIFNLVVPSIIFMFFVLYKMLRGGCSRNKKAPRLRENTPRQWGKHASFQKLDRYSSLEGLDLGDPTDRAYV